MAEIQWKKKNNTTQMSMLQTKGHMRPQTSAAVLMTQAAVCVREMGMQLEEHILGPWLQLVQL